MMQDNEQPPEDNTDELLTNFMDNIGGDLKNNARVIGLAALFIVASSAVVTCTYKQFTNNDTPNTPDDTPTSFDRDSIRTGEAILVECNISPEFSEKMQARQETKCHQREASQKFLKPFSNVELVITRN